MPGPYSTVSWFDGICRAVAAFSAAKLTRPVAPAWSTGVLSTDPVDDVAQRHVDAAQPRVQRVDRDALRRGDVAELHLDVPVVPPERLREERDAVDRHVGPLRQVLGLLDGGRHAALRDVPGHPVRRHEQQRDDDDQGQQGTQRAPSGFDG